MPRANTVIAGIAVTVLVGTAFAQGQPNLCEGEKVNVAVGLADRCEIAEGETFVVRGKFNANRPITNNGVIVFANPSRRQRLKTNGNMGHVVIGQSPADIILDSDLEAETLLINSGATLDGNGHKVIVNKSSLDVQGRMIEISKAFVKENLYIGKGAEWGVGVLEMTGTGTKIITPAKYAQTATWSGSYVGEEFVQNNIVLVATGTLLTATGTSFTSFIEVASVLSGTGFELARYANTAIYDGENGEGALLYATGALLPSSKPNLGFIPQLLSGAVVVRGSGWSIPFYKPAVNLGNVIIK